MNALERNYCYVKFVVEKGYYSLKMVHRLVICLLKSMLENGGRENLNKNEKLVCTIHFKQWLSSDIQCISEDMVLKMLCEWWSK